MSEHARAEVLLRLAEPTDAEAVGELTGRVYQLAGFLDGDDDPYLRHLRDGAGRMERAEVWVATDADGTGLLGAVAFCPDGSSMRELAGDGEGEFRMLVVDPDARGRGVGERLVRRCLARSAELGHHAVVLSSLDSMHDAHRLYQRLGFVRTPERDWEPVPGVFLRCFRLELTPEPVRGRPVSPARA